MSKIKVLFIHANNSIALFKEEVESARESTGESNDYLSDSLYLEMKLRPEFDVYDCPAMLHMYTDSIVDRNNLTGFGFTLRKKLPGDSQTLTVENACEMIRGNFFDLVFTDSRTMNKWWFDRRLSPFYSRAVILRDVLLKCYPKNKIIFLDGEDQPDSIISEFYGNSLYFKRELQKKDDNLNPIGYSFPQQFFRKCELEEKTKSTATVIPWLKQTYIFTDENSFYEDYRQSLFGFTCKKLGWDCFRHHEIIFSSCLPIFNDVEECPEYTLTRFPKEICKKILKMDGIKDLQFNKCWIAPPPSHGTGLYYYTCPPIDMDSINMNQYKELLDEIIDFSFNHNSSKKMLDYVLSFT